MGKIFAPHIEYKPDYGDWDKLAKYDEDFTEEVRTFAKTNGSGTYAGEILQIPHADGYAQYVVMSLKPVQMIHLPIGDGWDAPYVHRMTANDIKWEIERKKNLAKIWAKHATV